jgi:Protein of unknown function (DUF1064)
MQINLKEGKAPWKQEWAEIGGKRCFFRSRWEYRYALYLEFMKTHGHIIEWEHEPLTFYFEGIKRGTTNYKPDFRVTFPSSKVEWFEVKGYESAKDRTKYKRMAKYYPDVVLRVIGKDWFQTNGKMLRNILKGW